ncbi:hypothetical protein JGU66_07765 [Myxococcaceae bacterium JPH2]|nr:hypothetical protein [Myxococcaceae bacterium JPH2]
MMTRQFRPPWRGLASLALLGALAGCGGADPAEPTPPTLSTSHAPSWEDFLARSTKHVDGRDIYVVEWDRPLASLEALRAYYDQQVAGTDTGSTGQSLMVNQVNGVDDLWRDPTVTHLSYCVSTAFGSRQARVRQEMHAAASSWARLANVAFIDDPTQDGSCTGSNFNVMFAVVPWNSDGACSFFPNGDACVARTLVINYDDFDTNPNWQTIAPNMTTEGVLRHELGHILGFRHEHTNPASGTCFENSNWRSLTPYDPSSVMHYQWCNGVLSSDMTLTNLDERGSVSLYGLAVPAMSSALLL